MISKNQEVYRFENKSSENNSSSKKRMKYPVTKEYPIAQSNCTFSYYQKK
jgi:hypothetical protein